MNNYFGFLLILQALVVYVDGDSVCGFKNEKLGRFFALRSRSARATGSSKVSGSKGHSIRNHPWQAALITEDNEHQCGGVILSEHHVLSAAHCLFIENEEKNTIHAVSPNQRLIVVGSSTPTDIGLYYNISQIYTHPEYGFAKGGYKHDIAVLKIVGGFIWTLTVFPICLPDTNEEYKTGRSCTISGYGEEELNPTVGLLRYGEVEIMSEDECKKNYGANSITEGMFCAAGYSFDQKIIDTCKGDSGGPLYCETWNPDTAGQYILLGVTSFGAKMCGQNRPGVYTKVSNYLSWIQEQIDISNTVDCDPVKRPTACNLVFQDEFKNLSTEVWRHDVTGGAAFEYYRNRRQNSFVKGGKMHIRTTLIADELGEDFLHNGKLFHDCGEQVCVEEGSFGEILPPVYSAKLTTIKSFPFKFGRVDVRAKMPRGDWLRPVISMIKKYGPQDIRIVEMNGNKNYTNDKGQQMGVSTAQAFLPCSVDKYRVVAIDKLSAGKKGSDFSDAFHTFSVIINATSVSYAVDGIVIGEPCELKTEMNAPEGSEISTSDREFWLEIRVVVGGAWYEVHDFQRKPNLSFWEARKDWKPTWDRPELIIDYIRVYQSV